MTILSADQVAGLCHATGFTGESLVTAVAVSKAESGFDSDAVGDAGLMDETWAASHGLFQVRCLHAERGTGGVRDELANHDPAHNARSAFAISAQGTNFKPWSVFLSGTYRRHVETVRAACMSVDPTVPPAGSGDSQPVLRQGDSGPEVSDLQRRLNDAGFPCAVDGIFGPQTDAAVRAFQESRQLAVDGVVGQQTWSALTPAAVPA